MERAATRCGAIAAALFFAAAGPVAAQIYHWTDAEGHEHFSSDPARMPRGAQKGPAARAGTLNGASGTGQRPTVPAAPGPASGSAAAPSGDLAGGHDEAWWRDERGRQVQAIDELDAKVTACKSGEAPPPEDPTTGQVEHNDAKRRAARNEACKEASAALETKRRDLESFEERARQQGVPPGWLR